jgi:hypothetical protein
MGDEKEGKEEWYQHGNLHRTGGPAIITFTKVYSLFALPNTNENLRNVKCEKWYLDNKLRLTVNYDATGKKINKRLIKD